MRFLLALAVAVPGYVSMPEPAYSAGTGDAPPKSTNTTRKCLFGRVWDADAGKCVKPAASNIGDDALYDAVRELAYDGQYGHAQTVLRAMSDQSDDRALTYWGFTHRKMGETDLGNAFYEKAITVNPDNILARSYMGQGFVEEGKFDLALAQWREIRSRGGEGTWAEVSLRDAIRTGVTRNY